MQYLVICINCAYSHYVLYFPCFCCHIHIANLFPAHLLPLSIILETFFSPLRNISFIPKLNSVFSSCCPGTTSRTRPTPCTRRRSRTSRPATPATRSSRRTNLLQKACGIPFRSMKYYIPPITHPSFLRAGLTCHTRHGKQYTPPKYL